MMMRKRKMSRDCHFHYDNTAGRQSASRLPIKSHGKLGKYEEHEKLTAHITRTLILRRSTIDKFQEKIKLITLTNCLQNKLVNHFFKTDNE